MAKARPQVLSLNGGEVDLEYDARADLENYQNKSVVFENALPAVKGGMFKAPGTRFIGRTPAGDGEDMFGVLRPWVFGTDQAFVIEFVEGSLRVVSGTGYIQTGLGASSIATWTDRSTGSATATESDPGWPSDPWTPGYVPPVSADPPVAPGFGGMGFIFTSLLH